MLSLFEGKIYALDEQSSHQCPFQLDHWNKVQLFIYILIGVLIF